MSRSPMNSDDQKFPEEVSAPVLADLLGCSERQVRQWANEGVIEKAARGKYRLAPSVQAVVKRAIENGASETEKQRREFMRVKAEALALDVAERKKALVPLSEVDELVVGVFGALKSEILALPARVTRDIALRRQIDAECVNALNRAAKKLAERGAALRGGEPINHGEEDADDE